MSSTPPPIDSSKPGSRTPIAVVGIGCLFPGAPDTGAFWATLRDGIDQIREVPSTHWNSAELFDADPSSPDRTYGRAGGFLDPVDLRPLELGIAPRDLEATDTAQLLGLLAAREALRDASLLDRDQATKRRVSVVLGVTGALELVIPLGARLGHPIWWRALAAAGIDRTTAGEVVRRISDGYTRWQENSFPGLLGNVVAGRIANRLDLGGTNCVVDAACASSLGAVHLAVMELESGRTDAVVSGGVDTFNDIFMYACFSKTPALSPSGHARPFDRDGDGTTLGEGIGMLVLKRLADAERDGDKIYAKILGVGSSSDGRGTAIYAPSAEGQVRCLESAYREAGVTPDTIGLVEAHGTGTAVGDATEVRALTEVFRRHRAEGAWCQLGSVKSQIGHAKAAAGAAGLIKAVLALHMKVLPPTIKVEHPLEELAPGASPFELASRARPWIRRGSTPRRAGVSAFGFGGSNFHAVLEEASEERVEIDFEGAPLLLSFSAEGGEGLDSAIAGAERWSASADLRTARAHAARLRDIFDPSARDRLLLVASIEELGARIARARAELASRPAESWSLPEGIHRGIGSPPGTLAFLFPGQGSQRVGMLRDLACRTPELRAALEEAEAVYWLDESDPIPLAARIYPSDPFETARAQRQDEALRNTRTAQPAIGAASLGALRLLARFNVRPEAVAGHSFGELTALHAAGRIRAEDLHQLANFRGRLMSEASADAAGAMAAIDLPLADLDRLLAEERFDLVVANRNAPRQGVLSGRSEEIARALAACERRGVRTTRLPVSAAFHSPLVAGAREPFREVLRKVRFEPGQIPIYANTTGERYPGNAESAKELLAGQLAHPVHFLDSIEAMLADGVATFLEVGPGALLTGLVRTIAGERAAAIAVDASAGRRDGMFDLAQGLAQLASRGHAVDLRGWDGGVDSCPFPPEKRGPSILVSGANLKPGETVPLTEVPAVAAPPGIEWTQERRAPLAPVPAPVALTPVVPEPVQPPAFTVSTPPASDHDAIQRETLAAICALGEEAERIHEGFLASQREIAAALEASMSAPAPASVRSTVPFSDPLSTPVFSAAAIRDRPVEDGTDTAVRSQSPLVARLVRIVADRTGYPAEAIDPSMDLEADLGIDSIKRVEILSALRTETPELPSPPPELLGTLRTLCEIAGWFEQETAAAPAATPPAGGATSRPTLIPALIQIVADRTGYPVDAIDPAMDLESDLGIDSIKRVEILSALRTEHPELPSPPPELLGTLRTLAEIAGWFDPQPASESHSVPVFADAVTVPPASATTAGLVPILVSIVADRTGYPVDAIDPTMDLESDLGIDSIKRVEILSVLRTERPELPSPPPELLGGLRTLVEIADWFAGGSGSAAPSAAAAVSTPAAAPAAPPVSTLDANVTTAHPEHSLRRRIVGVRIDPHLTTGALPLPLPGAAWVAGGAGDPLPAALASRLRALGVPAETVSIDATLPRHDTVRLLVLVPPPGSGLDGVLTAFARLQDAAAGLRQGGENGGAQVVTVSRLDGAFGLRDIPAGSDLLPSALSGLAKTVPWEWSGVEGRAVDFDPALADHPSALERLAAAVLTDGPAEIGIRGEGTVILEERDAPYSTLATTEVPVGRGELVLITGGARGVTAECAIALARGTQATCLLLGRSPLPDPEPAWSIACPDETALKRALFQRQPSLPPREIGARVAHLLAGREMRRTLDEIERAGGRAIYRAVDVRDRVAVAAAIASARAESGPVRAWIHGAGVIEDRTIEEKRPESFERVVRTKFDGAETIAQLLPPDEVRGIVLFSSSTARYGRKGQVDYAVANEALNRLARREALLRPNCRVVAIGWGPWDGGMVTPSLAKLFATEGVGLVGLEAGSAACLRELAAPPGAPAWVTVLGSSPREIVPPRAERDRTASPLVVPPAGRAPSTPELEAVDGAARPERRGADAPRPLETALRLDLDPEQMPVLRDHVIDGRAVLPFALMLEWAAEAALHRHPGLQLAALEEWRVLKGAVLPVAGTLPLDVRIAPGETDGDRLRVAVELVGTHEGNAVLHARGTALLAPWSSPPPEPSVRIDLDPDPRSPRDAYDHDLFHGPSLRTVRQLLGCGEQGIAALCDPAPPPGDWLNAPRRGRWVIDPLLIDAGFQLLILWSTRIVGAPCLPCYAERIERYGGAEITGPVTIQARISDRGDHGARADIEVLGADGDLILRTIGAECVIDSSLARAFRARRLGSRR